MSLKLKTILGVALIEALLLAVLIGLTMDYLRSTNYDGLYKRASTTATLFASTTKDAVLSFDLASLESFTSELIQSPDILYVRILSAEGDMFAQAGEQAYLERIFSEDKDVSLVEDGVFDIQASIREGGELYGIVQLGLDTAGLNRQIDQAWQWSAVIAMGEMVLVALFSFILGSYLTSQLGKLHQAVNEISKGKTGVEVKVSGNDEIADVAKAFNKMSDRLKQASDHRDQYEQELHRLNHSLEEKVHDRTRQLSLNLQQLKQTNAELKQTQTHLVQSEKMASIGTLAAGVAHEINNPVGFVMSNVSTLVQYIDVYDGAVDRLEKIQQAEDLSAKEALLQELEIWLTQQDIRFIREDTASLLADTQEGTERIKDIVAGLKEFSHVDQDKTFKPANLNAAIEQTLKVAVKYSAEVITKLESIPDVLCDIGQIRQVLLNLIINAGHAVGDDGKILIRTGVQENMVFVSITDNGCGIKPSLQKKIFDPFFTTKEPGKGTGLGLAIAYGIMEEHKGTIELQSQPGKGTRFILRLPKSEVSDKTIPSED
ncbi:sensor histidine kinase [Oceanospirillum sediminis]|uniref:histidine kinase n=1 Tax=Oceanospirillum sediminis TaxID=2760088 RepID=A0A839INV1_9GAMM|nr:ATP-binding protein [Oceanospirillum sediminis]MBB1486364.1 HAMP domain-containing protein [Oceanospirillum sediminis]